MMGVLLRKELRAQLPFLCLILFLLVTSVLWMAISKPLTIIPTGELFHDHIFDLDVEWTVMAFVIAFAMASGLLVREFDDRTIEFMDAMPVSRTQWFFAKLIAAMACLATLPFSNAIMTIVIHAISSDSLDHDYHFDWIAISSGLQLSMLFCFLSIGLAVSFLRRFGWLALGLVLWSLVVLGELNPRFAMTNWLLIPEAQFDGRRWLIPWRSVVSQLALGMAGLAVAYGLFLGGGQVLLRWLGGSSSRWKQAILMATSVAVFFVYLFLFAYASVSTDDASDPKEVRVTYPSWSSASRSTGRFDAVFPTNLAGRADGLLDDADEIYAKVAGFLGDDSQTRIQVDMTSASGYHLGTAYWNKLKLDLTAHDDLTELRRTFGHEITHVVLENLAENQLRENASSTRFFHEGVATYVERHFFTEANHVASLRLNAAVQHSRGDVDIHVLLDDARLRRDHDSLLAYDLGEIFAAATVRRFGEDSLGKIAKTFAEKRHTEGLENTPLWRSVFQATGYSLNGAIDEFFEMLDELAKNQKESIDKILELHPLIEVDGRAIVFEFDEKPADDWEIVIRFRCSAGDPDNEYWMRTVGEDGVCFVPTASFPSRVCWYELGWKKTGQMPILQPWQKLRL